MKMRQKPVTKKEVYEIADSLAEQRIIPSKEAILSQLGRGSHSTIHKYLQMWREDKFFNKPEDNPDNMEYHLEQHKKQNVELKKQTELLSQELINTNKENLEISDDLAETKSSLGTLEKIYQDLKNEHEKVSALYKELSLERGVAIDKILEDKNSQIEKLQKELKKLNEKSMQQLQELSDKFHQELMEEKVKNMNLAQKLGRVKI